MADQTLTLLLAMLDQAYDKRSWHGPNLRGSLRGLSAHEAALRPVANRHNIWEQTVHAAYWKYVVWRRLTGEKRGSFPLKGSNWIARPDGDAHERAWKDDLRLLNDVHRALRDAVETLPKKVLHAKPRAGAPTNAQLITGIAGHDIYHAGQINLLKRLIREPS